MTGSSVDLGIAGIGPASLVGSGGSGSVYRAEQTAFARTVAVKVLHAPMSDPAVAARFQREQRLAGQLTGHPNIARIYDSGTTPTGSAYLIMEDYTGGTLADLIRREGALDPDRVVDIGVKIAGALQAAHEAGIIHRDVKPANILFDRFGEPVLSDFGIAGLIGGTTTMTNAFTIQFAPPEVLDEPPQFTEKGDQYSLALTLWAALIGGPPREPFPSMALRPAPGGSGLQIAPIVGRATRVSASERFADMNEFALSLESVRNPGRDAQSEIGGGVSESTVGVDGPTVRREAPARSDEAGTENRADSLRRRWFRVGGVLLLLALAIGVAAVVRGLLATEESSGTSVAAPPKTGPTTVATRANERPVGPADIRLSEVGQDSFQSATWKLSGPEPSGPWHYESRLASFGEQREWIKSYENRREFVRQAGDDLCVTVRVVRGAIPGLVDESIGLPGPVSEEATKCTKAIG